MATQISVVQICRRERIYHCSQALRYQGLNELGALYGPIWKFSTQEVLNIEPQIKHSLNMVEDVHSISALHIEVKIYGPLNETVNMFST